VCLSSRQVRLLCPWERHLTGLLLPLNGYADSNRWKLDSKIEKVPLLFPGRDIPWKLALSKHQSNCEVVTADLFLISGDILDRQTVYDRRNEICLKYILDQSSSNDCLVRLAGLHCSVGDVKRLIMPIRISLSTRGRIESNPNSYHYTNFKLSYQYYYCPLQQERNISKLQILLFL